jgi:type II secretory pathway pseudopilin PulG
MSRSRNKLARHKDAGYALLLIMFFLALLVVSLATAAPTVLSTVQREREKEMVWRGKQYTRGIRLYYLKLHRFPTSLDDLTTPKTGIRFMRQAYKDPMNQVDGSWRLIYVGPNGQLIGSLNSHPLTPIGMSAAGMNGMQGSGSLFGNSNGSSLLSGGANGAGSSAFGSPGFGTQSSGTGQTGAVTTALANGTAASNANATGTSTDPNVPNPDDPSQPHSLAGPMDASNTIGGNIIGVGSKINKKSFLVYDKAKNYRLFEFIWDPSKDMMAGRASTGIGTPVQNTNGINPAGTNGTSPFSTGMNPGQNANSSQNPNPNGNQGSSTPSPDPNQNPPLQAPQ